MDKKNSLLVKAVFLNSMMNYCLEGNYILRLRAFCALGYNELDLLAFVQTAETVADDGAVVYEHIIAAFAFNEAVAFFAVEPLDGALFFLGHALELLS